MTDIPLDVLTFGVVAVGGFQLWMFYNQLRVMRETTKIALSALDRPYLVIQKPVLNNTEWREGKAPLFVGFCIHNYGKAPAIIRRLRVTHFRGPDYRNGRPPADILRLPNDVLDLPSSEKFFDFVEKNQRSALMPGSKNLAEDIEIVVPGGGSTQQFSYFGYAQLTISDNGISPLHVTTSYLMGTIIYEIPGMPLEQLNFTYRLNDVPQLIPHNDFPPFNTRSMHLSTDNKLNLKTRILRIFGRPCI